MIVEFVLQLKSLAEKSLCLCSGEQGPITAINYVMVHICFMSLISKYLFIIVNLL